MSSGSYGSVAEGCWIRGPAFEFSNWLQLLQCQGPAYRLLSYMVSPQQQPQGMVLLQRQFHAL